jgi:hypothetical protein
MAILAPVLEIRSELLSGDRADWNSRARDVRGGCLSLGWGLDVAAGGLISDNVSKHRLVDLQGTLCTISTSTPMTGSGERDLQTYLGLWVDKVSKEGELDSPVLSCRSQHQRLKDGTE